MKRVTFDELERFMQASLVAAHLSSEDARAVAAVFISATKRGVGHHDVYNFPARLDALMAGKVNAKPAFKKLAGFGCMESWDGDNGLGELINSFIMGRAVEMAQLHGMGLCAVRNSNHFLAGAPYADQAARAGCIGLILAKGPVNMGMPGDQVNVIGHSPMAFAFPAQHERPVMMDICLAYASVGQLMQRVTDDEPVPPWWGVGPDGQPTTDPAELLKGIRYPIGEHKGFGLAMLCELLTGVLSGGLVLDQKEGAGGLRNVTSHTAIAIKADALMDMQTYQERSAEMVERIQSLSPEIRIPGSRSYRQTEAFNRAGSIELSDDLFIKLNEKAAALHVTGLRA